MKGRPAYPGQSGETTGRTDLGRRVAARREALGLSREELGRRCGAAGNYIAYLEDQAASPAVGTLVRLADALGLTVGDLTGASFDRPPGRADDRRETALVALSEGECRRLLGTHGVGRIATFTSEGPAVLPVNYLVAGADIAFRTGTETKSADAAGTEVAFEIDNIEDATASGWSVLIVGVLAAVTDPERIHHLDATARSHPWTGGLRAHWMKLTPVRISGRRVVHDF